MVFVFRFFSRSWAFEFKMAVQQGIFSKASCAFTTVLLKKLVKKDLESVWRRTHFCLFFLFALHTSFPKLSFLFESTSARESVHVIFCFLFQKEDPKSSECVACCELVYPICVDFLPVWRHTQNIWYFQRACAPKPRMTHRPVSFGLFCGHEGSTFFVTSYLCISTAFKATIAIKVFKSIYMINTIDWRALHMRALSCTRGNCTPPPQPILKIWKNHRIISFLFWCVAHAQLRAQHFYPRHWIVLMT